MTGKRYRSASLLRRAKSSWRPGSLGASVALRVESLEERRLLHAGHPYDGLVTDPSVEDLLGYFPAAAAKSSAIETAADANLLTSIPALNSLLGAAVSLYLDFDGFFEAVWGGYSNITTPVFDQDGDDTTFSDDELLTIENIWTRVAEDFIPFNVNVTTVEPPSFANGVALRVAIGGDGAWIGGNYGGVAYVNNFTNSISNTVYVFPDNLSNGNAKFTAEVSSHEAGHGFGLQHQSLYDASGNLITEYYAGPGDGRAPIMGNSYSATRGLWWYGTSTSYLTFQDDMALVARSANGFGYRPDDHGNTPYGPTVLVNTGDPIVVSGIITKTSDADYFSFDTSGGEVTLTVSVPPGINNLDTKLQLRDENLVFLETAEPTGSFDAQIVVGALPAGLYYVAVRSNGGYGDVGQYTLTVDAPAAPTSAAVLGRALFYNQSRFDGNDAGVNADDDNAIAGDKVAYLPGDGTATFANISSYSRGINGVMIDVANLGGTLTAADFIFKVGANNTPSTWATAPAPSNVAVRAGAGVSGSDRIELTWAEGQITNTWLEVIFKGNDAAGGFNTNTGLPASDIFFFGNRIGDTGSGSPTTAITSAADQFETRNNIGFGVSITNLYDFDRSGLVSAADELISRNNVGFMAKIDVASPPAAPASADSDGAPAVVSGLTASAPASRLAAAGSADGGGASAVASALTIPHKSGPLATAAPIPMRLTRVEPPAQPAGSAAPFRARADDARELALSQASDEIETPALDDELLDRLAAGIGVSVA